MTHPVPLYLHKLSNKQNDARTKYIEKLNVKDDRFDHSLALQLLDRCLLEIRAGRQNQSSLKRYIQTTTGLNTDKPGVAEAIKGFSQIVINILNDNFQEKPRERRSIVLQYHEVHNNYMGIVEQNVTDRPIVELSDKLYLQGIQELQCEQDLAADVSSAEEVPTPRSAAEVPAPQQRQPANKKDSASDVVYEEPTQTQGLTNGQGQAADYQDSASDVVYEDPTQTQKLTNGQGQAESKNTTSVGQQPDSQVKVVELAASQNLSGEQRQPEDPSVLTTNLLRDSSQGQEKQPKNTEPVNKSGASEASVIIEKVLSEAVTKVIDSASKHRTSADEKADASEFKVEETPALQELPVAQRQYRPIKEDVPPLYNHTKLYKYDYDSKASVRVSNEKSFAGDELAKQIIANVNLAKEQFLAGNEEKLQIIDAFVVKVIEFAQANEGVGNVDNGEQKWQEFTKDNQVLQQFSYKDAKAFSSTYQKVSGENQIYTGRQENLRSDKQVAARLKRIPADLNDSIKESLSQEVVLKSI